MSFLSFEPSGQQLENSKVSVWEFSKIVAGLSALLSFLFFFHIEEELGLMKLVVVAAVGFILQAVSPFRWRLPIFFLSTIAVILLLFGTSTGGIIVALALGMFFLVIAPLRRKVKLILIVSLALFLAACRRQYLPFIDEGSALAVVGSLFMFRSILYLYEEQFEETPQPFWLRLSYFFLLPNVIFLIFPVVDYKTFTRNYFTRSAYQNYRQGILWMANGALHFLLYRLIYYYLIPSPAEVESVFGWLQFVIATYALIVRLAGIFHFSVGVICLFGFELPPTFKHYFFANSFSDLWRRINRYWRDFVMKIFYYPIYFKLKHLGLVPAIGLSVLLTFVVNWFLHAYQWFWIKGGVLFTVQDISFWAIFGIAVAGNSVYLATNKRKKKAETSIRVQAILQVLQVMGIFSFMAFLWSWWTAPSPAEWWSFLQIWSTMSIVEFEMVLLFFGLMFLGGLGLYHWDRRTSTNREHWRHQSELHLRFATIAFLGVSLIGVPRITNLVEQITSIDMKPVLSTQLNAVDQDARFQGYYETMLDQQQIMDSPLAQMQQKEADKWPRLISTGALKKENTILLKRLHPNLNLSFKGVPFTTNGFGLRDYPIDTVPPANGLRIALLGGSIEMGSGVSMEETFENVLTRMLNETDFFAPYDSVEILNFGVSGTHLPQHLARLERIVSQFKPDVVIYTAHSGEFWRVARNLHGLYGLGIDLYYPFFRDPIMEMGLASGGDLVSFQRGLRPYMEEIMINSYQQLKQSIEEMDAISVFMFLPVLDSRPSPKQDRDLLQLVEELDFPILNLQNFANDEIEKNLVLSEWDNHPNARGHQLIAEEIYRQLQGQKELRQSILNRPR